MAVEMLAPAGQRAGFRYSIDVTCQACGADTEMLHYGEGITGHVSTAIIRCVECRVTFALQATMRPVGRG